MNYSDLAFFSLLAAVAIGFYLVFVGFRQKKRIPMLGLTHAGLALSATGLLIMAIMEGPASKLNNLAAFLLFLAVIGGGLVFLLHEENKPPSMAAVVAHAIMGLIAFILMAANL